MTFGLRLVKCSKLQAKGCDMGKAPNIAMQLIAHSSERAAYAIDLIGEICGAQRAMKSASSLLRTYTEMEASVPAQDRKGWPGDRENDWFPVHSDDMDDPAVAR